MSVDASYIIEKLKFCVGDQAYHDKVIEDKSFTVTAKVDDYNKSIVVNVTYTLLPFDSYTRTIIHGYLRAYVLSCLADRYKAYEDGYTLTLYMPDFYGRFTSIKEIQDKSDFYDSNYSNKYYSWVKQRK